MCSTGTTSNPHRFHGLGSLDATLQRSDSGLRLLTVEAIRLQTLFVLFFIELGSRRVHLAGITSNPNEIWVTQQARQLVWELGDRETLLHFLIHDNDSKFSDTFDTVFESEAFHVIHTPYHAPMPMHLPNSGCAQLVKSAWICSSTARIVSLRRLLQSGSDSSRN